ncbi:MAG: EamA family transporter [Candidatus Heimdallarchaeota archaeon]|nr:EamA family transporter [Candidatus Heimdallarchaeota archaeon]
MKNPRVILYLGVLAVTTSSFIIRWAQQDAYSLAAARVVMTGIISLLFSLRFKYGKLNLSAREYLLIIVSGVSLASHFAWWFASLSYIPIGTSLSLTNTAPVWIIILSILFFKKWPTTKHWISIISVVIGTLILFLTSYSEDLEVQGLLLAVASAIGFAIYLLIAKMMVDRVGLWRYFGLVNSIAGITLLPIVLLQQKDVGIPELWIFGIILAIIPGMFGHAVYNWAMSKIDQVDVAIATLGEPVLGTILAMFIFAEFLEWTQIIGMVFLLLAILLTVLDKSIHPTLVNEEK